MSGSHRVRKIKDKRKLRNRKRKKNAKGAERKMLINSVLNSTGYDAQ